MRLSVDVTGEDAWQGWQSSKLELQGGNEPVRSGGGFGVGASVGPTVEVAVVASEAAVESAQGNFDAAGAVGFGVFGGAEGGARSSSGVFN